MTAAELEQHARRLLAEWPADPTSLPAAVAACHELLLAVPGHPLAQELVDGVSAAPDHYPLLGDLPKPAFLELVARLAVRREPVGTVLVREGGPGDACYLLAHGSVRVLEHG